VKSAIPIIFALGISLLSAQEYSALHRDAIVVDMHTDVLLNIMRGADISHRLEYGHVDLVRMKEGGIDVQFFAVWPDPKRYMPERMYDHSMFLIGLLEDVLRKNENTIELAKSPADIERIISENKMAACIGLEGGTAIENDLTKLNDFYNRGVRYLGLTWNDSPDWATSAHDESDKTFTRAAGLTDFGRQVIRKMNDLGIMVDVSHCGEQTFWDVIETTSRPVIASHSAVHALRWHDRNLTDAQIKAIAAGGGVIFVNFYPGYLDYNFASKYEKIRNASQTFLDSARISYGSNNLGFRKYRTAFYERQTEPFRTDIEKLFQHIDYIVRLVGEDHVGLGSDFDGISITPKGLDDVSKMPNLTRIMLEKGYSAESIRKILGGNFIRVFSMMSR